MGEAAKVEFRSAKVNQTTRFYREGSMLGGDLNAGPIELITEVELESDAPEADIRRVVRLAEQTCFTLQSMIQPVPVRTEARLNGASLALD